MRQTDKHRLGYTTKLRASQRAKVKTYQVFLHFSLALCLLSNPSQKGLAEPDYQPKHGAEAELASAPAAELDSKLKADSKPLPSDATTQIQSSTSEAAAQVPKPQIAIVIDDLGYSLQSARLLSELPYPLTLAVIPGTPHAEKTVDLVEAAKQELILHIPMEPRGDVKWEEGLSSTMERELFNTRLNTMLDAFPQARGINNHGGSLLTENRERMGWIMAELAKREIYFLDSRTTSASQAVIAADAHSVANLSRDVFLDNQREQAEIVTAFQQLREVALKHGRAIAIGHPHRITIEQLQIELPLLVDEGFELSFCSELTASNIIANDLARSAIHF